MKYLLIVASIFALAFPATAFAQTSSDRQADQKIDEMTFKGSNITGATQGPNGLEVVIPEHDSMSSFLEARQNFLPELMKSEQEI